MSSPVRFRLMPILIALTICLSSFLVVHVHAAPSVQQSDHPAAAVDLRAQVPVDAQHATLRVTHDAVISLVSLRCLFDNHAVLLLEHALRDHVRFAVYDVGAIERKASLQRVNKNVLSHWRTASGGARLLRT